MEILKVKDWLHQKDKGITHLIEKDRDGYLLAVCFLKDNSVSSTWSTKISNAMNFKSREAAEHCIKKFRLNKNFSSVKVIRYLDI